MNVMAQTLTDYQSLLEHLPSRLAEEFSEGLRPARVATEKLELDCKGVREALDNHGKGRGWLLFPAERVVLDENTQWQSSEQLPLAGEFVVENLSHRLTFLGGDRWLWVMTTIEELDVDKEGATHLLERVIHLAADEAWGRLHYDRVWQEDGHQGLSLMAAVLRKLGD